MILNVPENIFSHVRTISCLPGLTCTKQRILYLAQVYHSTTKPLLLCTSLKLCNISKTTFAAAIFRLTLSFMGFFRPYHHFLFLNNIEKIQESVKLIFEYF